MMPRPGWNHSHGRFVRKSSPGDSQDSPRRNATCSVDVVETVPGFGQLNPRFLPPTGATTLSPPPGLAGALAEYSAGAAAPRKGFAKLAPKVATTPLSITNRFGKVFVLNRTSDSCAVSVPPSEAEKMGFEVL